MPSRCVRAKSGPQFGASLVIESSRARFLGRVGFCRATLLSGFRVEIASPKRQSSPWSRRRAESEGCGRTWMAWTTGADDDDEFPARLPR